VNENHGSVDELRTRFAELAGAVVPDEDPYGRLMQRARRRRTRLVRSFVALAAALATFLAGQTMLGLAPGRPDSRPDQRRTDPGDGFPVDSEWTWRLINAPARGRLAKDPALLTGLARAFDQHRTELGVSAALAQVRIIFAEDLDARRIVTAVFHSDSAAALVSWTGAQGASAEELFASGVSTAPQRVEPFAVVQSATVDGQARTARWASPWLLGLAPPGCQVRMARLGQTRADGTVHREWAPTKTDGYLLLDLRSWPGAWEVVCDGIRRYQGLVGLRYDQIVTPLMTAAPAVTGGATDPDDPTIDRRAWSAYERLTRAVGVYSGAPLADVPVLRWSGTLPGASGPAPAVLLVSPVLPGPVVLQVGAADRTLVALASRTEVDRVMARPAEADFSIRHLDQGRPMPGGESRTLTAPATALPDRTERALVTPAIATSTELVAVRVPERDGERAVLGDRVFVVGPAGTATVDAIDGSGRTVHSAQLSGGAAILTVPVGTQVTLRALDAAGQPLATTPLNDPVRGGRLFDVELTDNW
jgi:hypothetical protein